MIRAEVAYDEAVPEITSPLNNSYTAENTITVEGQANPNKEIYLYKNGSEVAVVSSSEDGDFSAEISLTEGSNTITAKAAQGESLTRPSNQVEVILDSAPPIVSINSPQDGEEFNKTSVTVQGKWRKKI